MTNKPVDYKLFFAVFALIIFGMVMISSVSVYSSYRVTSAMVKAGDLQEAYNSFYVFRNIMHVLISTFLLLFLVKIPFTFYEKYAKYFLGASLFFLLYVLFAGVELNGATGWVSLPGIPFLIQPMEFAKFCLIVFLAYFFKKNSASIATFQKGFLPFLGLTLLIIVLLAMQPDFGGILMIVPIMFAMFFIAGGGLKYILSLILLCVCLIVGVYNFGKYDKAHPDDRTKLSYITDRIDNFLTDERQQIANKTINYQTEQALIAIGSGGFGGLGFGNSIQKFGYLPEVQGDFIFSVIIEELGFVGGLVLLSIYGLIGYRGYYISYYSPDLFAKFAAFGITTWILTQVCINICVNLNMFPLTGVTLPFVSYGGSSLLALTVGLGLLLSISRTMDETKSSRGGKRSHFKNGRVNLYAPE